ncbi:MAG: hypothetical protein SXA11_05595 [Cyanobacteriota bacterium]|nr:hypothetical protein [Cyanobacteriota bacterium]
MNAKQRLILEIENSPDFIVREVRKSLLIAKALRCSRTSKNTPKIFRE